MGNNSGIYIIKNAVNGKQYFGSTNNLVKRCSEHFNDLKSNEHPNKHLQASFNKYGIESFVFEIILDTDCLELLLNFEQSYLDEFWDGGIRCYNIASVAGAPMSGKKHTQETRDKMSKSQSGRKHSQEELAKMSKAMKGKKRGPRSQEHCDKMSKALKGRKKSQQTRERMARAMKGKSKSQEHRDNMSKVRLGKKRSQESRDKMSKAQTGRKHSQETRDKMSKSNKARWANRKSLNPTQQPQ